MAQPMTPVARVSQVRNLLNTGVFTIVIVMTLQFVQSCASDAIDRWRENLVDRVTTSVTALQIDRDLERLHASEK